jgi:hypothetical protein
MLLHESLRHVTFRGLRHTFAVLPQQVGYGNAAFQFLQDFDDLGLAESRLPQDRS